MTINERIRYSRKEILKMSQAEFAEHIGMKQRSVSTFEHDGGTVTNSTLKSICMAFNLNESWLRYGTEPMYNNNDDATTSLNELTKFIDKYGISDQELEFARSYLKSDPDFRHALLECFRKLFYSDKIES